MPDNSNQIAHLKQVAQGRLRLAAATGITGTIAGFILHAIISMPPVWIDQVGACL